MNDQAPHQAINGCEYFDDGTLAESLKIDYAAIAAATEPDQPGGRIVYDSGDYETDEEADEALEAFFDRILDEAIEQAMHAKV